jgi:formate dehydrogenase major subunit/formate dehydrogenase alpha subunit
MTNSINELTDAQVILVSGSNTTRTHPQVARRIYDSVDRGAKLIVIDPCRTMIAGHAHVHLQLRPGTDILLLNGIMRCILDENLVDDLFVEMRTENYLEMRDKLLQVDLDHVAAVTGVAVCKIRQAARMYAGAHRSVICYCLGVTQHICGTSNVQSYANLAMMTGHVEQEFTGVDPLRGQNNVQGACDMGALPNVLPGYQGVHVPAVRAKFSRVWGVELPIKAGVTLLDMTHGGRSGGDDGVGDSTEPVYAMFIMGENPLLSDPGLSRVEATLRNLDFLVVSDLFMTETARIADVVFPACSFAEKSGTFTNSERRVQYLHQAIKPIGMSMPDDQIIAMLSEKMGYVMKYESPAEIMEEICMLTPIYGGMYHDRLRSGWGLQWPCPDRSHEGTPYLHKYSFTRGRGRFEPGSHVEPADLQTPEFPFTLITGRGSDHQYHTGTMTRKSPTLNREDDKPYIEIHPDDALTIGVRNGEQVRITSRRGTCCFVARLTDTMERGNFFSGFHFHESPVNLLTVSSSDPVAKCPEFKVCAVQAEGVDS